MGVVILLVASCWVPCDGLAFHPGRNSNISSYFILGTLWWTSISCRGSSNIPSHFMLGTLWWASIPSRGVVIFLVTSYWIPCDGLAFHPGGSSNTPSLFMLGSLWRTITSSRGNSNTPSCFMLGTLWWTSIPSKGSSNISSRFMLQKPELTAGLMGHLARKQTLPSGMVKPNF